MEVIYKIAGISIASVAFCVLLKEENKPVSVLFSVVVCILIACISFAFLEPIISFCEKLKDVANIDSRLLSPVIKAAGVCFISQISSSLCSDYGENSVGKIVELSGSIMAIYVSIPLLVEILELVKRIGEAS